MCPVLVDRLYGRCREAHRLIQSCRSAGRCCDALEQTEPINDYGADLIVRFAAGAPMQVKELSAKIWVVLRKAVVGFIDDNALSRSAAMAFYATTSLAPVLLIVIAIAGLVVGRDAAELAVSRNCQGYSGRRVQIF